MITNTEELMGSPIQKMGLIIVEELNNPSYEFLHWLYENREGNTIILPEFEQDLEDHYLPRFRECITRGDQGFCNWLFITFKTYIHEINLSCIYGLCLIDHIKFIEMQMTCEISEDYYISQQWLVNLCRQTGISTASSPKDAIRYAEWLISNGRILILEPDVILSFIEYFVFVTREHPPRDTMKRILFVLMIIEPNIRANLIAQLFNLIINHFSIYPVGVSALVQIMGEVGLLSEPSARSLLLSKENDTVGFPRQLEEQMWQMSSRGPLDQEDAVLRLAIDLISDQYFTDIHKSAQVFKRLVLLDKDTRGTISQFGMIFLRVLLRMKYNEVSHAHVGRMIFHGYFLPSLDNMSPHLADTIIRLILIEGNNFLMPWFDEMIRKNKRHITLYLAIANSIIYDRILNTGISLERLRSIIVILDADINTGMLNQDNLDFVLTEEIALVLLGIFTKKNDKGLNNLVDKCLSECMRVGTTLSDYRRYVGPLTLERILRTCDMGIDDCVKQEINDYVRDNLREYLRILLSEIGDYSCFQALLEIPSKISDCIYLDHHWVIIGSQKYDLNADALFVSNDAQTYNHCEPCGKALSEAVFHDLEDKHGIYKCSECSSSRTRASCNICMTTDDIKVIICGHTYCKECLTRLTIQHHPACPMCREHIPTNKVVYSYEEIISKLFEEVDASAENTRVIARSLYNTYHVEEEDSDAEDDLRTE